MATAKTKPKSKSKSKTQSQANATSKSGYSVHPSVAMVQKWIDELPEKTGRTIDQWMPFIKKDGPSDEKGRRDWLKTEYGMGTNSAWWLAERASKPAGGFSEEDPQSYLKAAEHYVEKMFEGSKAGLRPIYGKLLSVGLKIGPESKACPCQTIVPLYRNHVFAEIKPSTRTRIDLGFALGVMLKEKKKIPARLIDTGGFAKKDRITHRIEIATLKDINDDVKKWLKIAYDLDGS